jgi:carboxymethylenebutenolidase
MTADGPVYVDFLKKQKGVGQGKVGVVGYCFTGATAMRMAAASPDDIAAAASFHGGRLVTPDAESPHLLLPRIKSRLYFGHAEQDQSMTAEQIATLEAALRDWHGAFQSETYEGARHGWTVPGRAGVYNELQAERAFEKLVELFDATLK